MNSIVNIGLMLIVFIIVLALAYFVSKALASHNGRLQQRKNLKVIETIQIAPNKYIQLVKIGTGYYAIGLTKDKITTIDKLDEKDLDLSDSTRDTSFKSILDGLNKGKKNRGQEEQHREI